MGSAAQAALMGKQANPIIKPNISLSTVFSMVFFASYQ
jgi:hypothetical protein